VYLDLDGVPPELKHDILKRERKYGSEAMVKWEEAKAAGSEDAFKYAQASSHVKEILR